MKKIILASMYLFFITAVVIASDKIKGNGKVVIKERTLTSFNSIAAGGSIDITIDETGKEGATVETDENLQDVVITEVKDNVLQIHLKENTNVSYTKMIVHVACSSLEKISTGGSGDVSTLSTLKGNKLEISHGGSGDFDLALDVKELKINNGGSGDYKLKGTANSLIISAAGSGDINAAELNCTTAKISAAGSGDVKLKKGVKAEVSSAGSGKVSYE